VRGPTPRNEGDRRVRRGSGGWHDLSLRAQGLVVFIVPTLGLITAVGLLVVDIGTGAASSLSLATAALLGLVVLVGTVVSFLYLQNLARRVNHLQANAERLARDAELSPAPPGTDEISVTEETLARAAEVLASRRRQLEEARASLEHLVSAGPMVMFAGALATRLDEPSPLTLDYISANSARVMGHSPIAMLREGSNFIDLVHPDDLAPLLSACRRAVGDTRSQVTVEFRVRHLDGSWRWMEGMVRGHEVEASRILGYAVDITARRQAESAHRESESRLSAFLDNSSALVSLKDPFGRYQFGNRAFTELIGRGTAGVAGTDDFDHWPDAAPALRARDQRVLVSRQPLQFEEVIDLPDGPHTYLSVKFPLLDEGGVPVAVGSISTDITEVKEALDTVAARERVLSTVIGASPDIITILEDDGTIRTTSVAFERIFGYPTRAVVNKKLYEIVHPDDADATRSRLDQLRRGDQSRVTLRFRSQTSDGVWVTIESHAQVISRSDGSLGDETVVDDSGEGIGDSDGVVMVSRDITDQIALEQALRQALEQAEKASMAKSAFLSRVSHELRTPLNAMLGFTQLLEMEDLVDPAPEYIGQISRAGSHLLDLINEVLDIGRIESQSLNLRLEPVSTGTAVNEVLELTAPLAARAGIALHGPDRVMAQAYIRADRQRLLQVLLNLVSNAIKYNEPGGRVDVTVAPAADRVTIGVHDTGPGLSADQIERLFIPFDRLGLEHSGIEGTGVGLALSHGLTEHMGGTLSVKSLPGAGSSFLVEMPAAEPDDKAVEVLAESRPSSRSTDTPGGGVDPHDPSPQRSLSGGRP
jgi:PAS domain S-box-containing protein